MPDPVLAGHRPTLPPFIKEFYAPATERAALLVTMRPTQYPKIPSNAVCGGVVRIRWHNASSRDSPDTNCALRECCHAVPQTPLRQ